LQAVSTLCFGVLTITGPDNWILAGVIAFENLTGGMGTTAFVAFMLSLTNRAYTATQYALLSSFMGVPRVFAAAPTGYLVQVFGWWNFFVMCTLVAIPGMLLLLVFAPFKKQ
jgi:PAT family beta-lactamase induction signal transducer AmpG